MSTVRFSKMLFHFTLTCVALVRFRFTFPRALYACAQRVEVRERFSFEYPVHLIAARSHDQNT